MLKITLQISNVSAALCGAAEHRHSSSHCSFQALIKYIFESLALVQKSNYAVQAADVFCASDLILIVSLFWTRLASTNLHNNLIIKLSLICFHVTESVVKLG